MSRVPANVDAASCFRLLTVRALTIVATLLVAVSLPGCNKGEPGKVYDEAHLANRPASSFPAAALACRSALR